MNTGGLGRGEVSASSRKALNILMVASSFPVNEMDWRSVFMRQLADALGRHPALMTTLWAPPGQSGPGVKHDLLDDEKLWLERLMAEGGIAHLMRARPVRGLMTAVGLLRRLRSVYRRNTNADVRHVNWLQNALALPNDGSPLLVTALGSDLELLNLAPVRMAVRHVLRSRNAIVCPNAGWMVEPLRRALGDDIEIREVAFGIDAHWYEVARRRPMNEVPRWLAVTRLTRGKLGDLFEWAAPWFDGKGRELHLFGPMQEAVQIPQWVIYHGPATPQQLREDWFPKAAGLVTLSRHAEGRPQVMLEAMAAGLPVIASNIAAHASFLRHGETAWLCNDADGLGQGLELLEIESRSIAVGQAARDWVHEAIGTWDDCAQRYYRIYRELLGIPLDD